MKFELALEKHHRKLKSKINRAIMSTEKKFFLEEDMGNANDLRLEEQKQAGIDYPHNKLSNVIHEDEENTEDMFRINRDSDISDNIINISPYIRKRNSSTYKKQKQMHIQRHDSFSIPRTKSQIKMYQMYK